MNETLNIGCGDTKFGDIRLDINRESKGRNIIADAHYLPFQANSFSLVYCDHVLEHLQNPYVVLNNMKRVSKKAIIKVPNKICELEGEKINQRHLYTWNKTTLKNLLKTVYKTVEVEYTIKYDKLTVPLAKRFLMNVLNRIFHNELTANCNA